MQEYEDRHAENPVGEERFRETLNHKPRSSFRPLLLFLTKEIGKFWNAVLQLPKGFKLQVDSFLCKTKMFPFRHLCRSKKKRNKARFVFSLLRFSSHCCWRVYQEPCLCCSCDLRQKSSSKTIPCPRCKTQS